MTGQKYELWEVNFLGWLRLQKLHVIDRTNPDADKNAQIFAELCCANNRSLTLIFRVTKNDGAKALKILRDYSIGDKKPRLLKLFSNFKNHSFGSMSVTDRSWNESSNAEKMRERQSDSILITKYLIIILDKHTIIITNMSSIITLPVILANMRDKALPYTC